jgi:hypothetical protein
VPEHDCEAGVHDPPSFLNSPPSHNRFPETWKAQMPLYLGVTGTTQLGSRAPLKVRATNLGWKTLLPTHRKCPPTTYRSPNLVTACAEPLVSNFHIWDPWKLSFWM